MHEASLKCARQVFSPEPHIVTDSIDFTVALYWSLDIIGTFFTAFHSSKGEVIRDHKRIALHYLTLGLHHLDGYIIEGAWLPAARSHLGMFCT